MTDNPSSGSKPGTTTKPMPKPGGPFGFRVIGAMKMVTGLGLFAAWFGMFRLFKSDLSTQIDWFVRHFRLDPDNRVFHMVFDWIDGIDPKKVRVIEAGTFFYALLHTIEGTGLLLEKDWAGYLTIIATSSLVPFELYEVYHKVNILKILVLMVNIGFVVYLVVKLRQEHRQKREPKAAEAAGRVS